MPFCLRKYLVTFLNLDGPGSDVVEEVPNPKPLEIILLDCFTKESLLLKESITIACLDTAKFVYDEGNSSLSFSSLKAVLQLMLKKLTRVGETKDALLKMEARAMQALHSLIATTSCQIDHIKAPSLP